MTGFGLGVFQPIQPVVKNEVRGLHEIAQDGAKFLNTFAL